jgi:hypothetical protein
MSCLYDGRWGLVSYLIRDIARAIDPSPGLSSSLEDIAQLQQSLSSGPRKRKLQNDKVLSRLIS